MSNILLELDKLVDLDITDINLTEENRFEKFLKCLDVQRTSSICVNLLNEFIENIPSEEKIRLDTSVIQISIVKYEKYCNFLNVSKMQSYVFDNVNDYINNVSKTTIKLTNDIRININLNALNIIKAPIKNNLIKVVDVIVEDDTDENSLKRTKVYKLFYAFQESCKNLTRYVSKNEILSFLKRELEFRFDLYRIDSDGNKIPIRAVEYEAADWYNSIDFVNLWISSLLMSILDKDKRYIKEEFNTEEIELVKEALTKDKYKLVTDYLIGVNSELYTFYLSIYEYIKSLVIISANYSDNLKAVLAPLAGSGTVDTNSILKSTVYEYFKSKYKVGDIVLTTLLNVSEILNVNYPNYYSDVLYINPRNNPEKPGSMIKFTEKDFLCAKILGIYPDYMTIATQVIGPSGNLVDKFNISYNHILPLPMRMNSDGVLALDIRIIDSLMKPTQSHYNKGKIDSHSQFLINLVGANNLNTRETASRYIFYEYGIRNFLNSVPIIDINNIIQFKNFLQYKTTSRLRLLSKELLDKTV